MSLCQGKKYEKNSTNREYEIFVNKLYGGERTVCKFSLITVYAFLILGYYFQSHQKYVMEMNKGHMFDLLETQENNADEKWY